MITLAFHKKANPHLPVVYCFYLIFKANVILFVLVYFTVTNDKSSAMVSDC